MHSNCCLMLEAFDKHGNRVDRGGAIIAARVIGTGCSAVTVVDSGDGSYALSFSCAIAGECKVVVRLDNHEMPSLTVSFVKGLEEGPGGALVQQKSKEQLIKEKEKEFEQAGDYSMASVYAKLHGEHELTPSELQDASLVREKVGALTHLGEMKWRYRVIDEEETPRGAALAILTQANDLIEAHIATHQPANGDGRDREAHDEELRRDWAAELTAIWMGLALTRLIFNGDKRSEDRKIDKILAQALKLREDAGLLGPLAETHNALGSLRQKQRAYVRGRLPTATNVPTAEPLASSPSHSQVQGGGRALQ